MTCLPSHEFFKNIQGGLDEKTQKTIERALKMEEQAQVTPARKKVRFSLDDEEGRDRGPCVTDRGRAARTGLGARLRHPPGR